MVQPITRWHFHAVLLSPQSSSLLSIGGPFAWQATDDNATPPPGPPADPRWNDSGDLHKHALFQPRDGPRWHPGAALLSFFQTLSAPSQGSLHFLANQASGLPPSLHGHDERPSPCCCVDVTDARGLRTTSALAWALALWAAGPLLIEGPRISSSAAYPVDGSLTPERASSPRGPFKGHGGAAGSSDAHLLARRYYGLGLAHKKPQPCVPPLPINRRYQWRSAVLGVALTRWVGLFSRATGEFFSKGTQSGTLEVCGFVAFLSAVVTCRNSAVQRASVPLQGFTPDWTMTSRC